MKFKKLNEANEEPIIHEDFDDTQQIVYDALIDHGYDGEEAFNKVMNQEYYYYEDESDLLESEGGYCFDYWNHTNIADKWDEVNSFIDWDDLLWSIKVNGDYIEYDGHYINLDY